LNAIAKLAQMSHLSLGFLATGGMWRGLRLGESLKSKVGEAR
jgi:hypothetical protein